MLAPAVGTGGHRSVPHTADLRIEAWSPTRNGCIREAVLGTVESFLDTSSAQPHHTVVRRLSAHRDDDLLVAVLEEVIYLLDTTGEAPVDVEVTGTDDQVEVRFAMADAGSLPQAGAVPKAVSLTDVRLAPAQSCWRCLVTLDV
ncbi:archease [Mycobacterium sp.]|uniref:archease n=1 Tax=Mycobacterium sp. TaxID=1785 RepID=UPI0012779D58|nr:archease [Mycobacterium sp.]KAA8968804.1 MAG: archease [Mycobacterium sp.]